MRYVKWIFAVVLVSFLTSFVNKNKVSKGLNVGDKAPDISVQSLELSDYQGTYVLLSFWASYDAPSRMNNAALRNELRIAGSNDLKMISISFDEYESVFRETLRKDCIATTACLVETRGESSELYESYHLERGFANYLLDENGIILAKNISADELTAYLN